MNVHISIAGLSLAVGIMVAGFFGMNLISGLETSPFAF
jgi:Mg2+ and Co2+ transporter CorA